MPTEKSINQAIDDLKTLLDNRRNGLDKQDADPETNDNEMAKQMRALFQQELVTLIDQTPGRFATPPNEGTDHEDTDDKKKVTFTGYVIGIDMLFDLFYTFRECGSVQICFGLDNTLEKDGQIQLIVKGIGAPVEHIFSTGRYNVGGGSPPNPPGVRPCPHNATCSE